jgi:UDP-glucose 4-epimerase
MIKKNVLILGGTGFIGRSLAMVLHEKSYCVRVFSPSASRYIWPSNIQPVTGHIEDKGLLQQQTEWADLIIHTISTTNPKTSESDPLYNLNSNLVPLVQLLEIIKNNPSKKLVFFSSGGGVYGKSTYPNIEENHPKNPTQRNLPVLFVLLRVNPTINANPRLFRKVLPSIVRRIWLDI